MRNANLGVLIPWTEIATAFSQLQNVCDYLDMHLHQPQGPTLSSSSDDVMSSDVTQRWIRFFNCVLLMNISYFRQSGESPVWRCCYCKHPLGPRLRNLHGLAAYLSCTHFFLFWLLAVLEQVKAGWSHLGTQRRSSEFLVTDRVTFSGASKENVSSCLITCRVASPLCLRGLFFATEAMDWINNERKQPSLRFPFLPI